MNDELFQTLDSLTFDDVLVVPGYSEVLPAQVSVQATLVKGITLNIPILSAAMDTVTEAPLAIALARAGGIGIIHRNMPPEAQAIEVDKVKRSESGMITDPITLPPEALLKEADGIMTHFHISGIPIVDGVSGKLAGILTNRDIRFTGPDDRERPVSEFMTRAPLVTAPVDTSLDQAMTLLQQHRIEKLPLLDENGSLKGLITVKDIQKKKDYPSASTDRLGRLLVGAAVGVGEDLETRARGLVSKGVDVVVIDTAGRPSRHPAHQAPVPGPACHRRERGDRRRRPGVDRRGRRRDQSGRGRRIDLHHPHHLRSGDAPDERDLSLRGPGAPPGHTGYRGRRH